MGMKARPRGGNGIGALDQHNELRSILGLKPVRSTVKSDPELDEAKKLARLSKTRTAAQVLNVMYAGEGPNPPSGHIIHWWGQFSPELPMPFTLSGGGHGWLEANDLVQATRGFKVLRDAVLAMKCGNKRTKEWAGFSDDGKVWYRWMLGDGRQMSVEFRERSQLRAGEKREKIRKLRL